MACGQAVRCGFIFAVLCALQVVAGITALMTGICGSLTILEQTIPYCAGLLNGVTLPWGIVSFVGILLQGSMGAAVNGLFTQSSRPLLEVGTAGLFSNLVCKSRMLTELFRTLLISLFLQFACC